MSTSLNNIKIFNIYKEHLYWHWKLTVSISRTTCTIKIGQCCCVFNWCCRKVKISQNEFSKYVTYCQTLVTNSSFYVAAECWCFVFCFCCCSYSLFMTIYRSLQNWTVSWGVRTDKWKPKRDCTEKRGCKIRDSGNTTPSLYEGTCIKTLKLLCCSKSRNTARANPVHVHMSGLLWRICHVRIRIIQQQNGQTYYRDPLS